METHEFTWREPYAAIARGIYGLRNNRHRLIDIFNSIFDGSHDVTFPYNASETFESSMDPFTFFASFNRIITDDHRRTVIRLALDALGEGALSLPRDFEGIPFVDNRKSWFFGGKNDRGPNDIDNLWDLFCAAIEYSDQPKNINVRNRFIHLFDTVRSQYCIKWNLTIGLYWIAPQTYMTFDGRSRGYLASKFGIKIPSNVLPSGEKYIAYIDKISEVASTPFYILSQEAYRYYQRMEDQEGWRPTLKQYDPGIDVDEWVELLQDPSVTDEQSLALLKRLKDCDGTATCSELSEKYGKPYSYYQSASSTLEERVYKKTGCQLFHDPNSDKDAYWPILFFGRSATKDEVGSFKWKMRPELSEALDQIDLSEIPLYASETKLTKQSPKNYWWLNANRKIWSFSAIEVGEEQAYTLYNDNGNPRRIFSNFLAAQEGDIVVGYETTPVKKVVALCEISRKNDGERLYFKKIRDLENPVPLEAIKADPVLFDCEFCKSPNGSFFKLTAAQYQRLEELFDEDDAAPEIADAKPYSGERFLSEVFVSVDDFETMKELLQRKKNLILQGAPGTGKTFAAKRLAYAIMGDKDDTRIFCMQFHQSSSYEDFVIGYRPTDEGGFEVHPGVFTQFCKRASLDSKRPYFFIIDEINRANISKVFGELLMLIEADHRGEWTTLSLDGSRLTVPKNLYIIGMMNTADRGLALIDYALRRRFAFFSMKPALDNDLFLNMVSQTGNKKLKSLIDCAQKLNQEIRQDPALGEGFCIGHSYFCLGEEVDDRAVEDVVHYELEPLIAEYWFDDPDKIRNVSAQLESALK